MGARLVSRANDSFVPNRATIELVSWWSSGLSSKFRSVGGRTYENDIDDQSGQFWGVELVFMCFRQESRVVDGRGWKADS